MPRHICACLLVEHICTGFFSCYCSGCSGDSNGDWMDYGYSICIVSQSAWRRSCRKLSLWQEPRWQEWLCRQSGWCHFQVTILCRGLVGLLLLITIYVLRKIWKGEAFWRSWKRLYMMVQIVRLLGGLSSHLFVVWDMKLANWYVWKIDHAGFWFIVTLICHHFSNVSDNSSSNGEWLQNSNCDAGDAYERSWSECLIIQVIARALRSFFPNSSEASLHTIVIR